ncbi:MAG: hypothetical protein J5497_04210, partial [Selenomonadaceae bacterium]|nr:hypothetical protein [Selenomonadaceae bacterium]
MQQFIFDLQRFATQMVSAGGTYALDGVTYTAVDGDAVLNLDDDGKVSGIASGKVQAVVTGATDSPSITFDATQTAIPTALTAEDGSLALNLGGRIFKFAEGTATITGDKVTMGTADFSVSGTYSNADYRFKVEDSAEFSITADSFSITSEKLSVDVVRGGRTLNFGISGTAIRNFTDHTFALASGTSISTAFGNYTFNAKVPDGASVGFNLTESGIIFSPDDNDGSLVVSINRGDTPIFGGTLSVNGSVVLDPTNNTLTLKDGSSTEIAFGGYTLKATANGDATTAFAIVEEGLVITPNKGDGTLKLTLG